MISHITGLFEKPPKKLPPIKSMDQAELVEFIVCMETEGKNFALRFMLKLAGFCVVMTFLIILLQGFRLWGFSLPEHFLDWLGAAVIGEVIALLWIIIKYLFNKDNKLYPA
jgi:hypothetical protein